MIRGAGAPRDHALCVPSNAVGIAHADPEQLGVANAVQVCELWEANFGYVETRNAPHKVFGQVLAWDHESLLVAVDGDRIVGTLMVGFDSHRVARTRPVRE